LQPYSLFVLAVTSSKFELRCRGEVQNCLELEKMPVHERESADRANAELLRQIEESLAHSRDVIAQINEVLARRYANLQHVRAGGFRF
jgi:hypothetical protein